jgi:outer membrane receptor protein involved in Fe transport
LRKALRRTLLATATLAGAPAFAQADPTTFVPAAANDQADSGDVVVTARRRTERLMDVPVVVSTLSGETLARTNSNNLTAIGELSPTVIVGAYRANGGGTIAIRGISSPANQTGFEQAVSVAIDGVQTSNGRIAQLGFFDIEQVEILKGPQALFFGKNSPAGVISIRTAGPTREFQAGLRATYEFGGDEAVLDGFVAGPLSDALGYRVAIRYRNLDGWLRNRAGALASPFYNPATGAPAAAAQLPGTSDPRPGEEELLGRLTLALQPSDTFQATARLFGAHATDAGAGVATQNIGPCAGPNPRVSGVADPFGECVADDITTVGDLPPLVAETFRGVDANRGGHGALNAIFGSLSMQWDPGKISLASITGYNWLSYDTASGLDQTSYSQLFQTEKTDAREFSQELRLSSRFDGPVNAVLGAYVQRASLFSYSDTMLSLGNYNAASGRYTSFETVARQRGRTYSLFGQLLWDIAPTLELAGGLRWTRETKRFDKSNLYGIGSFNTAATNFPGSDETGHLQGRFADENLSPEVTLTWRPDGDHILFAAYRTGFKSGGFGLSNPLQTATRIGNVDFNSEEAEGFEIGGRAILAGDRLSLSAAAFAYDFSNLQVNTYDPARIAYTINNAGRVRQRGFEIEGRFRASRQLTLHGALAYVHNRFSDFTGQCYAYAFPAGTVRATAVPPPNCSFLNDTALTLQQVYDGRAPARSPALSGNAGFILTLPVSPGADLGFTGDASYSGAYYAADTLSPPSRQDAFWRLNAGVTLAGNVERWSVGLLARNITNRHYLLYAADRTGGAGVPGAIGEQRGVVSRGREIALQGALRF